MRAFEPEVRSSQTKLACIRIAIPSVSSFPFVAVVNNFTTNAQLDFVLGLCKESITDVRPKMTYRNMTNLMTAAVAAAIFAVGVSGAPVFAQQYIDVGCTSCSSSSQTINFPTSRISSMPIPASDSTWPTEQVVYSSASTQTLPTTTSSFVASTVSKKSYPIQVNETYSSYPSVSYPAATYATGQTVLNEGTMSSPVGTLTSMPAASYAAAAPIFSQPSIAVQPAFYPATPVRSALSNNYRAVGNGISNVSSGLAQRKAQQAANGGVRGHIGGGLGGARYEGVGWSSQSAQAAIQQCCYWGTRPAAEIGVCQGVDGLWYACVLYN